MFRIMDRKSGVPADTPLPNQPIVVVSPDQAGSANKGLLRAMRNILTWVLANRTRKICALVVAALVLLTPITGSFVLLRPDPSEEMATSNGTQDSPSSNSTGAPNKSGNNGKDSTTKPAPGDNKATGDKPGGTNGGTGSTSNSNGDTNSGTGGGTGGGGGTNPPTGGSGAKRSNYPERYSVGAPGVGHYSQSDPSLPIPAGYTVINPSDGSSKAYNMYNCSGVTNLDRVYVRAFIYMGTNCHGTINITNSIIAPPPGSNQRAILVNSDDSDTLTINISNTTIRPEPVAMGGTNAALTDHVLNACERCTINMNRVDVANSGGMCLCGRNTTITNSWLHDNYIAHLPDPSVAHTGGVFPYADSGPLTIRNNRLEPGVNAATGQPVPNYWQAITAVLFTQSSGGSVLRNYIVENNFISLGAFDMGLEDGRDLIVRNNVFGPNHWGYTTTCSSGCTVTYADWSGNVSGDIDGNPTGIVVNRP